METTERDIIKLKFGVCLLKIISEHKGKAKDNKAKGINDHRLVTSLRKLSASSGIDFATLQKISKGTKNPACTTIVAIAEGLDMTLSEFFSYYDDVTDAEVTKAKTKAKKKV